MALDEVIDTSHTSEVEGFDSAPELLPLPPEPKSEPELAPPFPFPEPPPPDPPELPLSGQEDLHLVLLMF